VPMADSLGSASFDEQLSSQIVGMRVEVSWASSDAEKFQGLANLANSENVLVVFVRSTYLSSENQPPNSSRSLTDREGTSPVCRNGQALNPSGGPRS
jgi:hypothetical protein